MSDQDVEQEIAEQMGDDEAKETTAPAETTAPEAPDQDGDSDGDGDGDQEDGELSGYAPGVAEARLISERELEKINGQLDKENVRHAKRLVEIMGDDLGGHIPCPTCMDGIAGMIAPPDIAPLTPEQRDRMLAILGLDEWNEMPTATWAEACRTCLGYGKIKTGSHVAGRETTECEDCKGAGWINTRQYVAPPTGPSEPSPVVTGPTMIQHHDPDPRVDSLRADGYTVIPPLPQVAQ